ncbi:MAG: hypothetical protein IKR57_06510 [Bacilli bacterium]|nr:hypothetical protein [Bacilli bacterium]
MSKEFKSKLLSLMLSLDVILLAGCGNKVDCSIEGKHMHEYTNAYGIERYIDSENEYVGGYYNLRYDRTDSYIELTNENEELYKFISRNDLVNIEDNYDKILAFQNDLYDYLEFQYSHEESHIQLDSKGDMHIKTTTEYDWTTDPYHSSLTGRKRIITHVYYGYNIIRNSRGKFKLQRSGPVQDINLLVQMGYKYISSNLVTAVNKNDYLREVGITVDTDEYTEEYDGERVRLILK